MDKANITVTMPVTEYERLKEMENDFNNCIRMLERANVDGKATMTKELEQRILECFL